MPSEPLTLSPATRARLALVGSEFLAELLARETARHPENLPALAEFAHVATRLGRLEEGLAADQSLARLVPDDPTVRYNLACSLALTGRLDDALDALEQAVELGYDDAPHLADDEDLAMLREEPRFRSVLEALSSRDGA